MTFNRVFVERKFICFYLLILIVCLKSSTERVWVERPDRNGTDDWNGSTSPRKEFTRPSADNWRSREAKERERGAEVKEDDDGWRTAGRGERWGK